MIIILTRPSLVQDIQCPFPRVVPKNRLMKFVRDDENSQHRNVPLKIELLRYVAQLKS